MTARNLGRGLNALLGEGESEEQSQNVKMVMLSDLEPSPFQPRRVFEKYRMPLLHGTPPRGPPPAFC